MLSNCAKGGAYEIYPSHEDDIQNLPSNVYRELQEVMMMYKMTGMSWKTLTNELGLDSNFRLPDELTIAGDLRSWYEAKKSVHLKNTSMDINEAMEGLEGVIKLMKEVRGMCPGLLICDELVSTLVEVLMKAAALDEIRSINKGK